jgi:ankyrin repeat protein
MLDACDVYRAVREIWRGSDDDGVAAVALLSDSAVNSFGEVGWTPLFCAVALGRPLTIAALARAGADANKATYDGHRPIIAAANRSKAVLELLLAAFPVDVNARGPGGATALHVAASCGRLGNTVLLLAHGADPRLRNDDGLRASDLATLFRQGRIAAILEDAVSDPAVSRREARPSALATQQRCARPLFVIESGALACVGVAGGGASLHKSALLCC